MITEIGSFVVDGFMAGAISVSSEAIEYPGNVGYTDSFVANYFEITEPNLISLRTFTEKRKFIVNIYRTSKKERQAIYNFSSDTVIAFSTMLEIEQTSDNGDSGKILLWGYTQADPDYTVEIESGKYEVVVTARYANIDDINQYPKLIRDSDIERVEWHECWDLVSETIKPTVWNFTFIPTDSEVEHQIYITRPTSRL